MKIGKAVEAGQSWNYSYMNVVHLNPSMNRFPLFYDKMLTKMCLCAAFPDIEDSDNGLLRTNYKLNNISINQYYKPKFCK